MAEMMEAQIRAGSTQSGARATAPDATEIRRVFDLQQAHRWKMAATTTQERIERLVRLREEILKSQGELQSAMREDFRKHPTEVQLTEIYPVISEINHAVKHLHRWMIPKPVDTPLTLTGTTSEIRFEPKGVVLILSPWNYPFNLLVSPLVGAIAAGNCAILKPSSKVPATMRYLKGLIARCFAEREVALFEGSAAVADALLEFPFDHVFFTGSPTIGRKVMAAAAKHLASVTLELGGKSPAIVDETANPRLAASRILWGKLINGGQTCVAPDYALVHESQHDAFLAEARSVIERRYGATSESRRASSDFCRLVGPEALARLRAALEESVAQGAKIWFGGASDAAERYLEPTILTEVTDRTPIMRDEIFGPVLPVIRYRELDEALAVIRSRGKPLALYAFSRSEDGIERILAGTTAGGTCVNSTMIHLANPDLPFGGVGMSGMGNYHGEHGFRVFSHERSILRQGSLDMVRLFYPPYTESVRRLVRFATRFLAG